MNKELASVSHRKNRSEVFYNHLNRVKLYYWQYMGTTIRDSHSFQTTTTYKAKKGYPLRVKPTCTMDMVVLCCNQPRVYVHA